MSTIPALEVRDLKKTYSNGVEALKGISLSVQAGDFYAFLGPNGAGKSTLIGIISSLVNATSGVHQLAGERHVRRSESIRHPDSRTAQRSDADARPRAAGNEFQPVRAAVSDLRQPSWFLWRAAQG
ncbi:MAG TPA: ATP-binding cassette domain-containing protein, partial [Paraburkholderia sp.]